MKKNFKTLFAAFILLSAFLAISCSDSDSDKKDGDILASVRVTLADNSIAAGTGTSLTVTGIYADNTTADFSTQVVWISSNPAVATVDANGNVTALAAGATTITALYGFYGDSVTLTVTAALLTSIKVEPVTPNIANTTSQQFTATAYFSDASTQDFTTQVTWSSSNESVATIDANGYATSIGKGDTTIQASYTYTYGSFNGITTLTVSEGALLSISFAPVNPSIAKGTTQQFAATGLFEDNTTQTLTGQVDWYSSNTGAATIDAGGLATGVGTGVGVNWTSIINAVHPISGVAGSGTTLTVTAAELVSLAVTHLNPSIANGTSEQFTATGTFTAPPTQTLTTQVNWYSSDSGVADIGLNTGLAVSNMPGFTTINAVHPGTSIVSNDSPLEVTAAELVSIAITPPDVEKPLGLTENFTATGTYTDATSQDLTTQVTWYSSDAAATIDANGLATGAVVGTAFINAVDSATGIAASASGGEAIMNVTAAELVSIAITPPDVEKPLGLTQQFTAWGTYTDASIQNITGPVTWSSSNTSVVYIDLNSGLANAVGINNDITIDAVEPVSGKAAWDSGGHAIMNVTSAILDSIAITPSFANTVLNVPGHSTQPFKATGTYSDASTQDLTGLAAWYSNTAAATVDANGLANAVGVGTAIINAVYSGIAASDLGGEAELNVLSLSSIDVTPSATTVPVGQTVQFDATGNLSDLSQLDITNAVTWVSSDVFVATISNTAGSEGLANGVSGGTALINATAAGVTSSNAVLDVIVHDLTVEIYNVDCNVNSEVTVFYNTTHSGTTDAGAFLVDVWDDRASPPSVGDTGAGTEPFAGLAAGTFIYNSTAISNTITSGTAYAVVDSADTVVESDETNNVSTGVAWNNVYCSEGTSSSPIIPSFLPTAGQVGTSYSFYVISSLNPNPPTTYTLSLTVLTDDADLYVFDDNTYLNILCLSTNVGTTDEDCQFSGVTTAYVVVYGTKTSGGAAYNISIGIP